MHSNDQLNKFLADFRLLNPDSGIIDLKAHYRGFRYVHEILKMLPEIPEPLLLTQIFAKLTSLGRIHPVSTGFEPSEIGKGIDLLLTIILTILNLELNVWHILFLANKSLAKVPSRGKITKFCKRSNHESISFCNRFR